MGLRVISSSVAPPTFADADLAIPLAGVEEKLEPRKQPNDYPLDYRLNLLRSCAAQIEERTERLWWPALVGGSPAARRSVAVATLDLANTLDLYRVVPWMPTRSATPEPYTNKTVEVWTSGAWAARSVDDQPAGGWDAGGLAPCTLRITAEATPTADTAAPEVVEALARLFGWLDARRNVWSKQEGVPSAHFSGAMLKSGAAAALRGLVTLRA